MKRSKTNFVNKIGDKEYPIYLVIYEDEEINWDHGKYDLECEYDISGIVWFDIYKESIKSYEENKKGV